MDQPFEIRLVDTARALEIADTLNEPHIHDYEELLIGIEGEIEHYIDFRKEVFRAPFISFVTRGKIHRLDPRLVNGQFSVWAISFRSEFIPETTFQLYSWYHDHANLQLEEGRCFQRIITLCGILHEEMQLENPDYSIVRHVLSALFTMIEHERKRLAPIPADQAGVQNQTFRNFLGLLEQNFRKPEGVEFYAEKLFMSSRNLNIICQNIMQKSVSEMIEIRKLTEAKNLLIHSEMTISEIGYELGYNEKAYFTNVFKKKSGLTPSQYREDMRKLIS